jgi:hypothetical protein
MSAVAQLRSAPGDPPWKRARKNPPAHSDYVIVRDTHGAYFIAAYVEGRWESMEMRRIDAEYWAEIPPFAGVE